jgi:glycosyltransferase involved in cell wall biosynthesis
MRPLPVAPDPTDAVAGWRRASVLYVLSFVPTYVEWELAELVRRGVRIRVVLPGAWSRAAMWDRIRDGADGGGAVVHTADFHQWLAQPAHGLVRRAARLMARRLRHHPRRTVRLAARCVRDGTVRHLLAAIWLTEVLGEHAMAGVHSHFATDAAVIAALFAELIDVPFSVSTHANDIFVPRAPRRLPRLLARASCVFTISEFNRAHLTRVAPCSRRQIRMLHLGIDSDILPRWSPPTDIFTVTCTASGLGKKKGVAVLLEACRLLTMRGVRFRCQICGSDPDGRRLAELRQRIVELKLVDQVTLLGIVPWRALQSLVARSNVFVLPCIGTPDGDMDGIPVSLIEAMGIGVPVVSSRLSGIPELVEDGGTGLLTAPGDADGLTNAILRVLREPALARLLGDHGRRRVRDAFGLSRYVDGLLDAWSERGWDVRPSTRRAG